MLFLRHPTAFVHRPLLLHIKPHPLPVRFCAISCPLLFVDINPHQSIRVQPWRFQTHSVRPHPTTLLNKLDRIEPWLNLDGLMRMDNEHGLMRICFCLPPSNQGLVKSSVHEYKLENLNLDLNQSSYIPFSQLFISAVLPPTVIDLKWIQIKPIQ